MRIIDRYMLKQFVRAFVIWFVSLNGLYIVIDLFSNLDEFMRYSGQRADLWRLVGQFYLYRSVFFFDQMASVLALVAAMFTVTWIQRHNELTALMAAGVRRSRVLMPVLLAAAGVNLLAAISRETIIPACQQQISTEPRDLLGDVAQELKFRYDNKTNILLRGQQTFANERRIQKPSFLLPRELDELGRELVAENAFYRPAAEGHPSGYLLRGVKEPAGLAQHATMKVDDKPAILTPHDTPWLKPDECFVVSDLSFEQLTEGKTWKKLASTAALIRGLYNPSLDFGADVRVLIHSRIVKPLLDCTLLLLGLPLILTRQNRNIFVAVGLCVGVVMGFSVVVLGFQYLGGVYLIRPALAAWLPLIIFVPCAVATSDHFRH